jgi:NAD(P)-dependent dehydrogenase (short-subunit alcohol dehydrogenase family)
MDSSISTEPVSLAGQVAVVTGGSRGLGRAFALELASAGAAVAIVARSGDQLADTVSLIEARGGLAAAFAADVTDRAAVDQVVSRIEREVGPVDLLVNNAGVGGPPGPLWETDPDRWWYCIQVNVFGPLLFSRSVLPSMISRRRGRIINVASAAGTMAIPYLSAYVLSKTALLRFTENLAAEVREHGIGVFAISPGTVRTALTAETSESRTWLPWLQGIFDQGRDVPPDLGARLVLLVASGRADALSGRFLQVGDNLDDLVQRAGEIVQNNLYTLKLSQLPQSETEEGR